MSKHNHTLTENIICPFCGYEYKDSWEVSGDDGEMECGSCGEIFGYERIITVQYSTLIDEDICDHRNADKWDSSKTNEHFFDCDDCGKLEITPI